MKRHITLLYIEIDIFRQFWRSLAALTRILAATIIRNSGSAQMWMMSEGMRLIAQEGTTMAPLPYVIWRPPNVL